MRTDCFDYVLPERLIAQRPTAARDGARLLVVGETLEHRQVVDWPDLLPQGCLVVVNDTKVMPCRIYATRAGTGGRVELLLLRLRSGDAGRQDWQCLARSNRRVKAGDVLMAEGLRLEVSGRSEDTLQVSITGSDDVAGALSQIGHVPLPPYVRRSDDARDAERYQTVYARHVGSSAAPTAGLHLSTELLERLEARRIEVARVTLHVGPGTFRPVTVDDLDEHPMHSEWFHVSEAVVRQVDAARHRSAAIVAVGTTSVRALESAWDSGRPGHVRVCAGETSLLIQPGYSFKVVDALLTNFHAPRSTLLALVSAFAGLGRVRVAYRAAIEHEYRFLSYGDATWFAHRGDA